jgi:hypothetical protein
MSEEKDYLKELEDLKKEHDELFKKRTSSNYKVEDINNNVLEVLLNVLKSRNIKWKSIDSEGYVNGMNAIEEEFKNIEIKDSSIMLPSRILEVIYWIGNKYEGEGFQDAQKFKKAFSPFAKAINQLRNEDSKLKELRDEIGQIQAFLNEKE